MRQYVYYMSFTNLFRFKRTSMMLSFSPTTLFVVLGSTPNPDGSIHPAVAARIEKVSLLWQPGDYVLLMGRHSGSWPESEAANIRRHLMETWKIPAEALVLDERPKSTAQSLQALPQWEDWFLGQGVKFDVIKVISNAAYGKQIDTLIGGQRLNFSLLTGLTFTPAKNIPQTKAAQLRIRLAEWKARVDPFDHWVNQGRLSGQSKPVKALMLADDLVRLCVLTGVRALGFRAQPGLLPPFVPPLP